MSWKKVKLKEVAKIGAGQSAPKEVDFNEIDGLPFVRAGHLEHLIAGAGINNLPKIKQDVAKKNKLKVLPKGSILFAKSGMSAMMNRVYMNEQESYYVSHLASVVPNTAILDSRFCYYFLLNFKTSKLIKDSAYPSIGLPDIDNLEIPLPPLPTQKRIAEILDAADALRRKDQELLKKCDELAQAIFIDMFGDPVKNEKGWDVKKLDDVCLKITDGEHGTVSRLANGKPYLMARNIRDGFIDFTETDFISEADHNRIFKRCNPEKGDLLLVCVGATIGRVCLMNSNDEFSLARSVALIKPTKNLINSKFLFSIFKSDFIQLQIKAANNSSAQAGLYTGKIKDLNIFIPPIELQNEFEIRINILLQQSQCIDLSKSDALFKSLIQKAFKADLVA